VHHRLHLMIVFNKTVPMGNPQSQYAQLVFQGERKCQKSVVKVPMAAIAREQPSRIRKGISTKPQMICQGLSMGSSIRGFSRWACE